VRELMPGRSRVLYLDPDIIATGPLEELWTVPLGTNVLAAVPIPNSSRVSEHNMPEGSLFFNAGVLVIDVDAWEQRHYRDRCINYLIKHPERALDADQDILNLVLIGDWLPLDYKWNLINPFWRRHANSHDLKMMEAEVRTILADARLIHFNGQHKPWFYMDNHPRRQDYFDALAQTDWCGWQPPDRTALNMLRKGLSRALPTWVKEAGRAVLSRTK
jgi:lipopolysaccharide biosynthesis glycosyltransferase